MDPRAVLNGLNNCDPEDKAGLMEYADALLCWAKIGGFAPPGELEVVGHTDPVLNAKLKSLARWMKGGRL